MDVLKLVKAHWNLHKNKVANRVVLEVLQMETWQIAQEKLDNKNFLSWNFKPKSFFCKVRSYGAMEHDYGRGVKARRSWSTSTTDASIWILNKKASQVMNYIMIFMYDSMIGRIHDCKGLGHCLKYICDITEPKKIQLK